MPTLTMEIGKLMAQVDLLQKQLVAIQKEISQTLNCMHDPQAVLCVQINSMIIGKGVKLTDRQTTGIGEDGEPAPTLQQGITTPLP